MDEKWLVVYGDPSEGFCYVGAFDTYETAQKFAEENLRNYNWWVSPLEPPTQWLSVVIPANEGGKDDQH